MQAADCSAMARACVLCRSAMVYNWRADAAFVCQDCNGRIHAATATATARQERVWVCEVCESAPAAVVCKADAAVLCLACDADIHSLNPFAQRHQRLPLPLPPSHQLQPRVGLPDKKLPEGDLLSVIQPYVEADSRDIQSLAFHRMPSLSSASGSSSDGDFCLKTVASAGAISLSRSLSSTTTEVMVVAESSSTSESSIKPIGKITTKPPPSTEVAARSVLPQGAGSCPRIRSWETRAARVMRYKEKRKTRKFEKKVRYYSRKAFAEERPRVRGRFVKRTDAIDNLHVSSPTMDIALNSIKAYT